MTELSNQALAAYVNQLAKQRILVVGDVILDKYIWGDVERISPEAPVPVVKLDEDEYRLGGAANVATNLVALKSRTQLIGVCGKDEAAGQLKKTFKQYGLNPAGLVTDAKRPTTIKTRIMSMGQQLLRLDRERDDHLKGDAAEKLLAKIDKALEQCDAMILSDYDKGVLHTALCQKIIALGRKRRVPIVVDPKGVQYRKYKGATVIKPNQKEAEAASGHKIRCEASLAEAAKHIQRITQPEALVITRGSRGVTVFARRRKPVSLPAFAHSVYDVTGAGDTFIAVMSLALAAGAEVAQAAALGNLAGSIVVGKLGASTVSREELIEGLDEHY